VPLALLLDGFGRGNWGSRGGGAWVAFFPLAWILTLAAIGLIVYLIVRRRPALTDGRPGWGPPPSAAPRPDSALEIARARYARGEMSREEFLRVTSDLGGSPPPEAGPFYTQRGPEPPRNPQNPPPPTDPTP
jgi:uncharacterized membrane protein